MNEAERQYIADRELRDAARDVVSARIQRIREGLSDKPVARRATDEVLGNARGSLQQAQEMAAESRWIIAVVVAGTLAWLFRTPLLRLVQTVRDRLPNREPDAPWQRWLAWVSEKVKA